MDNRTENEPSTDATARLRAIIDMATDVIITIDEQGKIESANRAATELFGYFADEMLGQNVSMLMPMPYRAEHDLYLSRYLFTGVPHIIGIGRTVSGQRKDGSTFPLRLAVSEVQIGGRRFFTGIIHDLTEMKRAEGEILRLNGELASQNDALEAKVEERTVKLTAVVNDMLESNRRLNAEIAERQRIEQKLRDREQEIQESLARERELGELKTRFLSTASHEFRTPLSSILSSAEILDLHAQKVDNQSFAKHIGRIKSSVNQLTGILNDFLNLSKLEDGRIAVDLQVFCLHDFCAEIVDEMQGLLKPGQYFVHEEKNGRMEVHADKKIMKNILFNLVSNAIKYSPENSRIECSTTTDGQKIRLTVRDHGMGIPENDQPYLFGNFFRASNVENIPGTGLGLAIVKRYAELLGGRIHFQSKEGEGTVFTVTLPAHLTADS